MSDRCAVCSVECNKSCGHCKKISYCSVEHQISHRRKHKEECFPAIEKENSEIGRFFVATRDIQPLEVIWKEKPLMIAPDGACPDLYPMCLGCCVILCGNFQDGTLQTCSLCEWPLCSSSCKDVQWHSQFECCVFQQNNLKPMDLAPTVLFYEGIRILRLFIMKERDPEKWEKLMSMRSDVNIFRRSPRFGQISNYLTNFIRNQCKVDEEPDVILNLFGIVSKNCMQATDCHLRTPGKHHRSIIYERRSKMMHSCQPNTLTVTQNDRTTQNTYATVAIKSGEILYDFLKYDDSKLGFPGHVERRIDLHQHFQFWCKCLMCINPTEQGTFYSAIKCNKKVHGKTCPGYFLPCIVTEPSTHLEVSNGKWQCNFPECKAEENYSRLSKIIDKIEKEAMDLQRFGVNIAKRLKFISKHENVNVHQNHFLLAKMRFSILPELLWNFGDKAKKPERNEAECEMAAEQLLTSAQICLKIADKFHPGFNLLRGIILFYIVGEHEFRMRFKVGNAEHNAESERIRNEALSILKLSNAGSHPNLLYEQLRTEISTLVIFRNGFQFE